jgi:hypothetical protein
VVLGFGVPFAAAPAAGVGAVLLSAQVTDFLPVLPPVLGAALSWPLPPAAAAPTGVPNMVSATGVATSRCLLIWPSATQKMKRNHVNCCCEVGVSICSRNSHCRMAVRKPT